MAKKDYREPDEGPDVPGAEAGGDADRFPDKALVRAFAEDLLRKGQRGSYQPVESQRRRAPATEPRPDTDEVRGHAELRGAPAGHAGRHAAAPAATLQAHSPRSPADSVDDPGDGCDECLSEDSILAFVQGTLTGVELVRTHRHLDICPQCQRLIVEAVHAISASRRESATSDPQGSALRAGMVLGNRYRIQRFVARGGMGEVYEAYDRTLRERVALKTVMPTVSDSPRAVRRLMAEVQLARRVSHPNVCRIYDLGAEQVTDSDGTLHFLTMEFVEGLSLAQELERTGPLKVDAAVDIARQLLSGLEAAHEAGILHRDFKPDNIMLRPANGSRQRAVIMDFGLARAMDVDPARLTTGANQPLIGTLTYMAPEQVEGGDLTAGTDIFAFGIVFFEMLTGCVPFVAGSPAATALKRLKEDPPAPAEYAPDVPKHINRIVLKCLARHPSKRYASAAEVLAALDDEAHPNQAVEKPRRWRWAFAGLGGAAAVAMLLWAMPGSAPPPPASNDPAAKSHPAQPKTDAVVVRVDTAQQEPSAPPERPAPTASGAVAPPDVKVRQALGDVGGTGARTPVAQRLQLAPPPPAPPASAASAALAAEPKHELMVPSVFGQPPTAGSSSAGSAASVAPPEASPRANPP
ncbi:MAG TPA: serine/threonine-protein kinase [Polyangiaceae bacterium]|nr:serine/threonine-protein kinase [Polyangiaceae bacterium]